MHSQTKVEWTEREYNFGLIEEAEGPVTGNFSFINTGEKPVEIADVKVSCGCTDVEYSSGKIQLGDTAFLKVTFDPEDRPGKFDKGIYVFFEGENIPVNLRIKGTVKASEETLKFAYPFSKGQLHFDVDKVNFGEVKKGIRRREFIDIYNSGDSPITPNFQNNSEALSYTLEPPTINPGDNSTLTIYLDSSLIPWTGFRTMEISGSWGETDKAVIPIEMVILPKEQ